MGVFREGVRGARQQGSRGQGMGQSEVQMGYKGQRAETPPTIRNKGMQLCKIGGEVRGSTIGRVGDEGEVS
jgi:hypothetical protein